jgi:DnaK suppressor protein
MRPVAKPHFDEFSALLRARQAQLVGEVREKIAAPRDTPGFYNRTEDTREQAAADTIADIDVAMVARDAGELRDIEAALERIGDGSYGTCCDCGSEIGHYRLRAYPAALRCIDCQEKFERAGGRARSARP